jgi:hypothetical protein
MQERNSLATISQPPISAQPVSSSDAIRQFLVKCGEVFGKQITPALVSIWIEELGGEPADKLAGMFRHVLRTFKADYGRTFPTIADVLQPAENSPAPQAEANLKWDRVLEYIRVYWNPDFAGGVSRGAPRITERTMTAIRAAGGLPWIADCPRDQLVWAKKTFIESYTAWATLERDQYLLPDDSPIKALLSNAMPELPALCASTERYEELSRQAEEIRAKYQK